MTDSEFIDFGGIPMTAAKAQVMMQQHMNKPVTLRKQGTSEYICPYCGETHEAEPGSYHTGVPCADEARFNGRGIIIGDRFFLPGYGLTIMEYQEGEKVNKIIV